MKFSQSSVGVFSEPMYAPASEYRNRRFSRVKEAIEEQIKKQEPPEKATWFLLFNCDYNQFSANLVVGIFFSALEENLLMPESVLFRMGRCYQGLLLKTLLNFPDKKKQRELLLTSFVSESPLGKIFSYHKGRFGAFPVPGELKRIVAALDPKLKEQLEKQDVQLKKQAEMCQNLRLSISILGLSTLLAFVAVFPSLIWLDSFVAVGCAVVCMTGLILILLADLLEGSEKKKARLRSSQTYLCLSFAKQHCLQQRESTENAKASSPVESSPKQISLEQGS